NGPPVRLQMDAIVVRGTLRAGHQALPAALHFMNQRGPGDLTLVSREDGTFAGMFPAAGKYDIEITPEKSEQHLRKQVDVEPSSEGVVHLDIDLPGGVIHGNVVDESGAPATGVVQLYHRNGGRATSVSTTGDGTFRLMGVEPGDAVLNARSRSVGDSGPVPYRVGEESTEPVTLTLHPRRTVTMWIAAPSGQPVAGAVIRFSNRFYW